MKKPSTTEAMKQAFKDMKKSNLHPTYLFNREKLIKATPECTLRLGLVGL